MQLYVLYTFPGAVKAWVRLTECSRHVSIDVIIADANRIDAQEKENRKIQDARDSLAAKMDTDVARKLKLMGDIIEEELGRGTAYTWDLFGYPLVTNTMLSQS